MTMELICCESVLTLPVNCLVMFKNGMRMLIEKALPESDTFCTPVSRNTPPTRASVTYITLPMLPMIGPSVLASAWARKLWRKSRSLISSNSRMPASSWQKTLMTFCPFIDSWI